MFEVLHFGEISHGPLPARGLVAGGDVLTFDKIIANVQRVAHRCNIAIGGNFDEQSVESYPPLLDFLKAQSFADSLVKVAFKPIISTGPKPKTSRGLIPLTTVDGSVLTEQRDAGAHTREAAVESDRVLAEQGRCPRAEPPRGGGGPVTHTRTARISALWLAAYGESTVV